MANTAPASKIDVLSYDKSLKDFLRTFPQYTDYDFDGSNLSTLIRVLAYNAYNIAHYGGMIGNEAWIDSAQMRQSLVSHSTDLNYLPRSRVSAHSVLTVEVFPEDTPVSIVIPKYYRFKTTSPDGTSYNFLTNDEYVTTRDEAGRYIFNNVDVYQGDIIEEYFQVEGVQQENGYVTYPYPFVISSSDIDITSLEVYVATTQTSEDYTKFEFARTLDKTNSSSNTYFMRGIFENQYSIEFGDGIFGVALSNGNFVKAIYRNTAGDFVQGNYSFSKTSPISGYNSVSIISTRVEGGFEREDKEQIRINAPRFYQTQDRAITEFDYQSLIKQNFPYVQQVHVYGGERIQQYGKVIIVLKPKDNIGVVSNTIKQQIIDYLKTKNLVPEPIIVDPVYYYLNIGGNVYYNQSATNEGQILTSVIENLVDLNGGALSDFNVKVYQSLIVDTIKNSSNGITGCDVDINITKKWTPTLNINETLTFTLNNKIKRSKDGIYQNSKDFGVTSSVFDVFINQQITQVVIQDDGIGNLFYFIVSGDGTRNKSGSSVGTVDYDSGSVKVSANIYQYINSIDVMCILDTDTISIDLDSFAIVDAPYINLNMVKV